MKKALLALSLVASFSAYAKQPTLFDELSRGDVYVITGPVFEGMPKTIGDNRVWVPKYLYKLVYDATTGHAWAHWIENNDSARAGKPISYAELVRRTGIEFLPKVKITGQADE
jgi:endonuclease G